MGFCRRQGGHGLLQSWLTPPKLVHPNVKNLLMRVTDLQDLAVTLGIMCEGDIQQKLGLIYRLHLPPCSVLDSPEAEFGVEAMQFFKPDSNDGEYLIGIQSH